MYNYIKYDYSLSQIVCFHQDIKEYINETSIDSYLNKLCLVNGSSLKGRKEAFKVLTNKKKFIPVIVSPFCIYFPLSSTSQHDCIWVRYEAIDKVKYKEKTCILFFKDSTCLVCNSKNRIIEIFQSIQKYKLITSRTV